MTTQLEREASTLRICCELIEKHGPMTVVDLTIVGNLRSAAIRHALQRGIADGYLLESNKKKASAGKGNARKTYVRTKKRLPGVMEPAAEPIAVGSEFAPRRHWMDAALFGEYGRATS